MSSDAGTRLTAWLGFAGAVLAAIIVGVFGLVTARNGDKGQPESRQGSSTSQADPAASTTATPVSTGQPRDTVPTNQAAGAAETAAVRWQGTTVMQASTTKLRDFDQSPPSTVEQDASGDIQVWGVTNRNAPYGMVSSKDRAATVAEWTGGDPQPGYGQCVEAVAAQGVAEIEAVTGTVLCIRTGEGRTARLVAAVDDKSHSITFQTIVWEPVS